MNTQALGPLKEGLVIARECVKFFFCGSICRLSILFRIKVSKVLFFSGNNNSCAKFVSILLPLHAKYSGSIMRMRSTLVAEVFAHRGFAQIGYSVVKRDSIDVIDKSFRPNAMNVKPSKPMSLESCVPDDDVPATFVPARSSNVTSLCPSATNSPYKLSGTRVVIEKLAQSFRCQFLFYNSFSHDDSYKARLVRACVAVQTPNRLVYFTGVTT